MKEEEVEDTNEYQFGVDQCQMNIDGSALFLSLPEQSDYDENKWLDENLLQHTFSVNTGNNFDNNFLIDVACGENEIMIVNENIKSENNVFTMPVENVDFSHLNYYKEEIVASENFYDITEGSDEFVNHGNELSIHSHSFSDDSIDSTNSSVVMDVKLSNKRSKVESNGLISTAKKSKTALVTSTAITKNKSEHTSLQLTDEERKLARKEGIALPTNYPLTKIEDRELKRIRRKIRNKISAQDSRRRRKEYVDGLEEKVKRVNESQGNLIDKLQKLELENKVLKNEVKILQAALNRVSPSSEAPATQSSTPQLHNQTTTQSNVCLLLLVMSSLAFLMSPSVKNATTPPFENEVETDDNMSTLKVEDDLLEYDTSKELTKSLVNDEEITTTTTITTENIVTDFIQHLHRTSSPNGKTTSNSNNIDIFNALQQMHPEELLKEHDYFKLMSTGSESRISTDGVSLTSDPLSMVMGTGSVEALTSNPFIKILSELKNVASITNLLSDVKNEHVFNIFEQVKNIMHS